MRDELFQDNLRVAGDSIDAPAARAVWQMALDAKPWAHAPVWLHGDLHPANLLVEDTLITAVIDFGDLTSGDPATDLAVAWMLLPRHDRPAFWNSYATRVDHPVDADLEARSRGWAVAFAAVFLAHSADNPLMRQIGMHTAAAVLEPRVSLGIKWEDPMNDP